MLDSLETTVGKINVLWQKSDDYRATLGELMARAKEQVDAGDAFAEGLEWKNFARLHFLKKDGTERSPRTIRELLQIGYSPDPVAKAAEMRATKQASMQSFRENSTAPRGATLPPQSLVDPSADPVASLLYLFKKLSEDDKERFMVEVGKIY